MAYALGLPALAPTAARAAFGSAPAPRAAIMGATVGGVNTRLPAGALAGGVNT